MNRYRNILLSLAMAFFAANSLSAQVAEGENAVLFNSYETLLRRNFWEDGSNPAGIRQDITFSKVSFAEVYGSVAAGGFRQSYEASTPWAAGATARTLVHLDKFSMQGSFAFKESQGSNMCGSMFVKPGFFPIDALEFTPGRKVRQEYSFDGEISVDVADNWRLGAGMDFDAINLSKRKDVRHSNYFLDMTVSPGVIWHSGKFAIGLNGLFSKVDDTPVAKQIGTKETYEAFLDKGLYYGKLEEWSGSGLHLSESGVNGLPVHQISYGGALQIEYGGAFAELSASKGKGRIGEKQYIWFRFPFTEASLKVGNRWTRGDLTHAVRLCANWKHLRNNEFIIEKVVQGGISTTISHGSNQILEQKCPAFDAEYSLVSGKGELVVRGGIDETTSMASQMYPYVVDQSISTLRFLAGYTRHFGRMSLGLGAGFVSGTLDESDRSVSESSGVTTEPYRLEDYYQMDKEYRTARRCSIGATAEYDFNKGVYLKAAADCVRAFSVEFLPGTDRINATLCIGLKF